MAPFIWNLYLFYLLFYLEPLLGAAPASSEGAAPPPPISHIAPHQSNAARLVTHLGRHLVQVPPYQPDTALPFGAAPSLENAPLSGWRPSIREGI